MGIPFYERSTLFRCALHSIYGALVSRYTVRENKAKKGIEVEFDSKPSAAILEALRYAKFRWSYRLGYWWRGAWGESAESIRVYLEQADASARGESAVPVNDSQAAYRINKPDPQVIADSGVPAIVVRTGDGKVVNAILLERNGQPVKSADPRDAETIPF